VGWEEIDMSLYKGIPSCPYARNHFPGLSKNCYPNFWRNNIDATGTRMLSESLQSASESNRLSIVQAQTDPGGPTSGPVPGPAFFFPVAQWLKRPLCVAMLPCRPRQTHTMYLQITTNHRANYSQLASKMANELLRSSRV
jgi:hypothetical protein